MQEKSYQGLWFCWVETCGHLQADCCMCKQRENTQFSLWYFSWHSWSFKDDDDDDGVIMVWVDPDCNGYHFFLCFISLLHWSTQDPEWLRWSLNYYLHVRSFCDLLTPAGTPRIRPVSTDTSHITMAAHVCVCLPVCILFSMPACMKSVLWKSSPLFLLHLSLYIYIFVWIYLSKIRVCQLNPQMDKMIEQYSSIRSAGSLKQHALRAWKAKTETRILSSPNFIEEG